MSSFETQRRLTVVNACANVIDFTGGQEALAARAPFPPHALVQLTELLSSAGPRLPSSLAAAARASQAAPEPCMPGLPLPAHSTGSCRDCLQRDSRAANPRWTVSERQTDTQGCFQGIYKVFSSLSGKEPFSNPVSIAWLCLYVDGNSSKDPYCCFGEAAPCTSMLGRRSFTN